MPDDTPEILKVFDEYLKMEEHDPESECGWDVDEFLGFTQDCSFHKDIDQHIPANSWMREPLNFSYNAERRFQEACLSICQLITDNYSLPDSIPIHRMCVRIVEREFGSPYHRSINGYHYIVIPTGYFASVENYWRTYHALAVTSKVLNLDADAPQIIKSNMLGGASIEQCLQDKSGLWAYLLSDIFTDAIFWDSYDGPFSYPEDLARSLAQCSYEVIAGMYSSGDRNFRRASTALSKKLTRLTLLYVIGHEAAHAMLSYEGFDGSNKLSTEILCDMVSTLYTPIFISRYPQSWDFKIDGKAEYAVGPFGFFTMVEARYTIRMAMALINGDLQDGTHESDEWNDRFHEIQTRACSQKKLLESVFGEKEPDIPETIELMRLEIETMLIGIKMLSAQLGLKKESSFESVFKNRRAAEINWNTKQANQKKS